MYFYILKEYLTQYQSLAKDFHEKSYKQSKDERPI